MARADDLLSRLLDLQRRALALLEKAEPGGQLGTAVNAIREARGNLELLAELTQQRDRRSQINLLLSPEWQTVRGAWLAALYPWALRLAETVDLAEWVEALEELVQERGERYGRIA